MAIAGAGLAGLAFALSLLQHCKQSGVTPLPKITIFDRDASAEARIGQGYLLTVRSDTGGLQARPSHPYDIINLPRKPATVKDA